MASVTTCACGCGTDLASPDQRGRPRRFVRGHNGRRPLEERFWEKVTKTPTCWIWTGAKTPDGYGSIRTPDGTDLAHRVAWRLAGLGPIQGELDHVCLDRACVRPHPDHLEDVAQAENNRRSGSPSAQNARKLTCHRGHPFTPENTYVTPDGRRQCRTCASDRRSGRA